MWPSAFSYSVGTPKWFMYFAAQYPARAFPCHLLHRAGLTGAQENHMLDLFYVAIGLAGLLALWGLTRAFERI
jgi:hypothetical protein